MAKPKVPDDPAMTPEVRTFLETLQTKADSIDTLTPGDIGAQVADPQLSSNIPLITHNEDATMALTDGEKGWYHGTGSHTWTIPQNSSVAFPSGTAITFIVEGGTVTLSSSDTIEWFPTLATGSRTLGAGTLATILKFGSTKWALTGVGIT